MTTNKKPPIGLMPENLWKELRIRDLIAAINRYNEAQKKVPTEWISELQQKLYWLISK